MIMICITVIIIAVLAVGCILGYKYLSLTYNPELYKNDDTLNSINIIAHEIINRIQDYIDCESDDKYKLRVTDDEILTAFNEIYRISNYGSNKN